MCKAILPYTVIFVFDVLHPEDVNLTPRKICRSYSHVAAFSVRLSDRLRICFRGLQIFLRLGMGTGLEC